ncbi:MAG: hypothetical protein N2512_09065 [Armatimonadetes bacterium]|nr:hypothetical protein [Armatimonadota bacterium]
MTPDELFHRAQASVVSLSTADAAAQLAEANTAYGLAKIMAAQMALGLEPQACFIAGPDATITRHAPRWLAGFGYGGKLFWDFGQPAVVLDAKPNVCGMLVGGLQHQPDTTAVGEAVQALLSEPAVIDGVAVKWDFASGNHFIDVFAAHAMAPDVEVPPWIFIVHSSCPELRPPSALGPGLYYDASPDLLAAAQVFDTPWGPLHVLLGPQATDYLDFHERASAFAAAKRTLAAERLFGEYCTLFNGFHQGLLSDSEMLLGCHHSLWPGLLPLTLRPDLPAYLVRGLPNLRADLLDAGIFSDRTPAYVLECAARANIVPHGGGYALEGLRRLRRHWVVGPVRFFEMERDTGASCDLITDPTSLPMRYRGRQVLLRAIEFGLAQPVVRLEPILVVKA